MGTLAVCYNECLDGGSLTGDKCQFLLATAFWSDFLLTFDRHIRELSEKFVDSLPTTEQEQ